MEVSRRRVVNGVSSQSSNKIPLRQIMELQIVEVPSSDPKFAGCQGCSVHALMGAAKSGTGVFTAGDALQTEPIPFESLVQVRCMRVRSAQGSVESHVCISLRPPCARALAWRSGHHDAYWSGRAANIGWAVAPVVSSLSLIHI